MTQITKTPVKVKTGAPITIAEVKAQLNIELTCDIDDALLAALLAAVIESTEGDTNSDILNTVNTLEYELNGSAQSCYQITQAPFKTLTKIEAFNNDAYADIDPTKYQLKVNEDRFLWFTIEFLETVPAEKLKFTFSTGYTDLTTPKVLKQAILIRVADLYDPERQGYTANSIVENKAYNQLISKHKRQYY